MNCRLALYLGGALAIAASLFLGWQLGWHARGNFDRDACIQAKGHWYPNASRCNGSPYGEIEY